MKIEKCPFCGGEACLNKHVFVGYSSTFGVVCLDCCAETRQFYNTEEEAAEKWNRRAQPENDCPAHYDKSGCAMNSGFCIGGECSSYADAGMPENEPLTCEGCVDKGQYENEVEYGYPSPCTRCKRRSPDNYRRKPERSEG